LVHDACCGVHDAWCMVHDACCGVHDAWCMVHDAWCMVHDAWCMMHDAWCMMHDAWCMLRCTWCMMHDAWCSVRLAPESTMYGLLVVLVASRILAIAFIGVSPTAMPFCFISSSACRHLPHRVCVSGAALRQLVASPVRGG
jgi:hypothetical protein